MQYERIIVTDDGSALAEAAFGHAAVIGRTTGAGVVVLRVSFAEGFDPDDLDPGVWPELFGPAALVDDPDEAEPHRTRVVRWLTDAGVERVGSLMVKGEPGPAIVETATKLGCDLVITATHGLTGVRRTVLGSVSDHVARHGEQFAVLLCREAPDAEQYGTILLASDGSEVAGAAVPHAEHLAAAAGALVVLVRVAEDDDADDMDAARRDLQSIAERLRSGGVPDVRTEVIEGDPGEALVEAAERFSADVVVMGTHGRGGVVRLALGSVAQHVAHHASKAAVLLVRDSD